MLSVADVNKDEWLWCIYIYEIGGNQCYGGNFGRNNVPNVEIIFCKFVSLHVPSNKKSKYKYIYIKHPSLKTT